MLRKPFQTLEVTLPGGGVAATVETELKIQGQLKRVQFGSSTSNDVTLEAVKINDDPITRGGGGRAVDFRNDDYGYDFDKDEIVQILSKDTRMAFELNKASAGAETVFIHLTVV